MTVIKIYFNNGVEKEFKDCQILETLSNYIIGRLQDDHLEFIPKDKVANMYKFILHLEDKRK